jgi:hypothetical protein
MDIFDFITQDELDGLPEEPHQAFFMFVRHARRHLADWNRGLDQREESDWDSIQEARHGFTNVVLAAAKRFGIEPFSSMDVPRVGRFDRDIYGQLVADLDHYMTQLVLDTNLRGRADSTCLSTNSKDRIRSHLHHLREAVLKAALTESKKDDLLAKIDEFEAAMERKRLGLLALTRLTIEILAIPGTVWGSYEVVTKLLSNITQTVAESKAVDDDKRKLPAEPEPYVIAPPRRPEVESSDSELPF